MKYHVVIKVGYSVLVFTFNQSSKACNFAAIACELFNETESDCRELEVSIRLEAENESV